MIKVYKEAGVSILQLSRYLKNKNIALFPKRGRSFGLDRLEQWLSKFRLRQMAIRGYQVVVSEQIVENPLVLMNIRTSDRTVLDFGGVESVLPLQLSALGLKVTVLDQRAYALAHPNLTVVCRDILDETSSFDECFDVVVTISTVEHLGLGSYGDIVDEDADFKGVRRLWSWVKPGGRLMATVPVGKAMIHRNFRVYDQLRLSKVFPSSTVIRYFMKETREAIWSETSESIAFSKVFSNPDEDFPVECVAFILCEKL
jgi:2-polyprenyl-3-methyl-5-hydroxy-6-metoxy-1,4-benzoquinol methylase